MNDSTKLFLSVLTVIGLLIGIFVGIYFVSKWNNPWVDQIRNYCPDNTKMTDYSYARSHLGIDGELYGLECDGQVMDFKIKIENYRACEGYNKWNQCNKIVTKYNSTKLNDTYRDNGE